jgi:subtilisin family serine protease
MKKLYFVFSLMAVCVLTAVAFSQSAHSKFKASETGVAGRYIVLLNDKSASDPAAPFVVNSLANDIASSYGGTVERTYSVAVKGFSTIVSEEQAVALSNDSRVKLVEPDRAITLSSQQTNAPWHLDRIDQRALPWDTTYNYSSSGAGVHVYILDTGIRVTHQEFGGRASVANDFVGDGQNGNDCNGHGTHVAGLVGSSTWGVAKQASLHAVRILPCSGTGLLSNLLAAVDWVTANHASPAVANISSTAVGSSISLETAISNSIASGVVYTIAAGNDAADACGYTPARTVNAITVGASDETDLRALYSNRGPCIDIFAPGNRVTSAWASGDTAVREFSGSSMAAPIVAGAAALYLADNPAATSTAVIQAIKSAGTANVLNTLDTTSPNLLLYSRFSSAPVVNYVTISGRVVNSAERGIRMVQLTLRDLSTGTETTARTNPLGVFRFNNVVSGRTYILTAIPNRYYTIADNPRILNVTAAITDLIFTADTFTH